MTFDGRYRSDPSERLWEVSETPKWHGHNRPYWYGDMTAEEVRERGHTELEANPRHIKLGTITDEGYMGGFGGLYIPSMPYQNPVEDPDTDVIEHYPYYNPKDLALSLTDDFIHGLVFRGEHHRHGTEILERLKEGKKFDVGFDALMRPYLVGGEEHAPAPSTTTKLLGEESKGLTPSVLPQVDYFKQDEGKIIMKKGKGLVRKSGEGLFENREQYNIRRTEEERLKTRARKMKKGKFRIKPKAQIPEELGGGKEAEKYQLKVGEKDPYSGEVKEKLASRPKKPEYSSTEPRYGDEGYPSDLRGARHGEKVFTKIGVGVFDWILVGHRRDI